ncbi:MAG: phosphoribosylglycinamide formyltransferase [Chloroflexi bacterium]|nr:phosphoribosylglycinamide formyltransferase [Chloroflexota bacterium]
MSSLSRPPSSQRARLIVFISGSGTNLQAILDAINEGALNAEVVLVISNRKQAYGLVRAAQAEIPTLYAPLKPYTEAGKSRELYDADLAEKISAYQPDLLVLAGWMHIFTPAFLDQFAGRIINLHPALPGMLPGKDVIELAYQLFQAGKITESGCMMHYVVPAVDAGPVIAQTVVPFQPDDTLESFAARIHAAEHELIVAAIQQVIAGKK